jgi:hypothetical protein
MPLYSATCPLPKNKAAKRQQVQFPERIRITGPGVASNFLLNELNREFFLPYVVYYDNVSSIEFFIEGTSYEMYSYSRGMLSSGQIPSFSLPSSLANGYTVAKAHTTPTLEVSINPVQSKVYDNQEPSLSFTAIPSTIQFGEYLLSDSSKMPGTYTISLVEGSKTSRFIWGGPYPSVSYTITKRPVPLTMVDRSVTYSPFGTPLGQVLVGGLAANLPNGQGIISGTAESNFSGLLQNLPPSNSNVGTYTVSVDPNYTHPLYTISGYTNNKTTATVTINKATPTINFSPSSSATSGTNATLFASTSPISLPVTFSIVSGGAFANISGGNILNFTGAGTVVVRASTASSTNYNAASSADRSITVAAPASEGIPQRVTTLSDVGSFGTIEVGKEYVSWRPLTGSQVEDLVQSTTTVGGGTNSTDSFTSYLSPEVQTYNGNRDITYIILNPRHALTYGGITYKEPSWAVFVLDVSYDVENGNSYFSYAMSTNPSSDPYNFPTSGWSDGFRPYPQLARDVTVSVTGFYDIYNPTTHPQPYADFYQGTTPRVKVLQKQNRIPAIPDQANYATNSLWNNFQPLNIRGGARMPVFYALLGYQYTEDPNIPWGGTRQLIFGYTHENFGYGWPLTKSIPWTSSIVSSDYDITTLKNVWVFTSSYTYSHGDGSGNGQEAGTYYNVPSNTNANVLPPAFSSITSPTWKLVTNYGSDFSRNQLSAYTPNYSATPVTDIITGNGSIYNYLNADWVRVNVGDAVGVGYSDVIFLKSGTAYQDLYTGYIMLAPNSIIAAASLNETTVYPLSGGNYDAFACPANKWKIIYGYYESDYGSFSINETWEATSSNANRVPQTFTGVNGVTSSISFAPKSFY